jgi:hypothetical protein
MDGEKRPLLRLLIRGSRVRSPPRSPKSLTKTRIRKRGPVSVSVLSPGVWRSAETVGNGWGPDGDRTETGNDSKGVAGAGSLGRARGRDGRILDAGAVRRSWATLGARTRRFGPSSRRAGPTTNPAAATRVLEDANRRPVRTDGRGLEDDGASGAGRREDAQDDRRPGHQNRSKNSASGTTNQSCGLQSS